MVLLVSYLTFECMKPLKHIIQHTNKCVGLVLKKLILRLITGQFAQEPKVKVYGVHEGADPKKKEATMEVKGNKLAVTRYYQMQISLFLWQVTIFPFPIKITETVQHTIFQ